MSVTTESVYRQIALGEDGTRRFKANVRKGLTLASEIVAFANSNGGSIYIGVTEDGYTSGVSEWDVQRIHVLVEKASKQLVRGPVSIQTDSMSMGNGRHVVILTVPNGPDKPYFDVDGVIWVTEGAGKRRVDSKKDFVDLFQGALRLRTDDCQPTVQRRKSGAESDLGSTSSRTSGKRTVRRSESSAPATSKTSGKIIELVKENANVTIPELSGIIGVSDRSVERNLRKLQDQGKLRRIGPARGGYWEVEI